MLSNESKAHDLLLEGLAKLTTSEQWIASLDAAKRFHNYSWNNSLLLIIQGAQGRVAGYKQWQQIPAQGGGTCQVAKGEHGYYILAPLKRTFTETDEATGEKTKRTALYGFRDVRVFDETQLVSPPDLPEIKPELLVGEDDADLLGRVNTLIEAEGYTLVPDTTGSLGSANGRTVFADKDVLYKPSLSPAQRAKTATHELAHIRLHSPDKIPNALERERPRFEVEAESVAYLVCGTQGLDSGDYSLPYVAVWAQGNLELVGQTANRVVECARQIEDEVTVKEEVSA